MTAVPLMTGATGNGNAGDTCPRCGGAFHCGARDPAPCACTGLQLSGETLAALRQQFDGCLCLACLANIALSASPGAVTEPHKQAAVDTARSDMPLDASVDRP